MRSLLLIFSILYIQSGWSQNIYVDASNQCAGNCDGLSWITAFNNLQDGINNVGIGDTIFVAQGTYYADEGVGYINNDQTQSFIINDSITILGGYPSSGGIPDWRIYQTILSGDIQQDNDTINNSDRLLLMTISNSHVSLNGLYFQHAHLNTNTYHGAALKINPTNSTILISNCAFYENSSSYNGGAVCVYNTSNSMVCFENCLFQGNYGDNGSAIYLYEADNLLINQCKFVQHRNMSLGSSAIYSIGSEFKVLSSVFYDNYDGSIQSSTSNVQIINSSFYNNRAHYGYGGASLYNSSSTISVINSIFWADTIPEPMSPYNREIYSSGNSNVSISKCILKNSASGIEWNNNCGSDLGHNYDFNPQFQVTSDYALITSNCSKAIDNGNNNALLSGMNADILGNPRVWNNQIDIGAFESQLINPEFARVDSVIIFDTASCLNPFVAAEVFFAPQGFATILWDNFDTSTYSPYLIDNNQNWVIASNLSCIDTFYFNIETTFNGHTIYVDSSANGIESGCSWFDAFTKLQDALLIAHEGDTIKIAKGHYYPDEGLNHTNNVIFERFLITDSLVIMGGFPSGGLGIRNWQVNKTYLSGEIQQDTIKTNNSKNICVLDYQIENLLMDGIIICDAYTINSNGPVDATCSVSTADTITLAFKDCEFSNNTSNEVSMINISIIGSNQLLNLNLSNCYFKENSKIGTSIQGGILINLENGPNLQATFDSCVFIDNHAEQSSSSCIYIKSEDDSQLFVNINNATFQANSSEEQAGCLTIENAAGNLDCQISNCLFEGNESEKGSCINIINEDAVSHLEISNSNFKLNTGCAVYVENDLTTSYLKIETSDFTNNKLGDVFNYVLSGIDSLKLDNCYFNSYNGYAVTLNSNTGAYSDHLINNCLFTNDSILKGTGLQISNNSAFYRLNVISSLFENNSASNYGGGIYTNKTGNGYSYIQFEKTKFLRNDANKGGALYGQAIGVNHQIGFNNCLFANNAANSSGGAIYAIGSNVTPDLLITNSTFYENNASTSGNTFYFKYLSPKLYNSIIFSENESEVTNYSSQPVFKSCLINGSINTSGWNSSIGTDGGNNIDGNPRFENPDSLNFQLSYCSIALNVGDSSFQSQNTDLAGNPRFYNTSIDMGAFEFQDTARFIRIDSIVQNTPLSCTNYASATAFLTNSSTNYTSHWDNLEIGNIADSLIYGSNYFYCENSFCQDSMYTFIANTTNLSIIYVDKNATGNRTGCSWVDAMSDLTDALEIANAGDTIKVAQGTYYPDEIYQQDFNTTSSYFLIKDSVIVIGGYPTGGGIRNWQVNQTVLSGEIQQDNDSLNNSSIIVKMQNLSNQTRIDGFFISRANGNAIELRVPLQSTQTMPVIANCQIENNIGNKGAGIVINGNSYDTISPQIINCIFKNNHATVWGGAMYLGASNLSQNTVIMGCLFTNNSAGEAGSAIYGDGTLAKPSHPSIINCTFANNKNTQNCPPINLFGNTFFNLSISNCILWNLPGDSTQCPEISGGTSTACITNSIIRNAFVNGIWQDNLGFNWGNNAEDNPLFIDYSQGDYQLYYCSPAINAGENDSLQNYSSYDIAGNNRIIYSNVDIGAYEYAQAEQSFPLIDSLSILQEADCLSPVSVMEAHYNNPNGLFSIHWDNNDTTNQSTLSVGVHAVWLIGNDPVCSDTLIFKIKTNYYNQVYIDSAATGANNGCSWTDAFQNLQTAFIDRKPGDTLFIAKGNYYPDLFDFGDMNDKTMSYILPDSIYIYGGFPNGGGPRDIELNPSKLNGLIDTAIDSVYSDSLLKITRTTRFVELNGIQLLNSKYAISLILRNNQKLDFRLVKDKVAQNAHNYSSAIRIILYNDSYLKFDADSTLIADNMGITGTGISIESSANALAEVSFDHCVIQNNVCNPSISSQDAGAIYASSGGLGHIDFAFSSCHFLSNSASRGSGGALYFKNCKYSFDNCIFEDNLSYTGGGAVLFQNTLGGDSISSIIQHSTFRNNQTEFNGGAITFSNQAGNTSSVVLNNSLFTCNFAGSAAGSIYLNSYSEHKDLLILNSTFFNNYAGTGQGNFLGNSGNCTNCGTLIKNTICWNSVNNSDLIYLNGVQNQVSNSIIQGSGSINWNVNYGDDQGANLDEYPLFVDTIGFDYHLQEESPAINGGDTYYPFISSTDLDGNPRIMYSIVDIGCYEYNGPYTHIPDNNNLINIKAYPIPVKSDLIIEGLPQDATILIVDALGRQLQVNFKNTSFNILNFSIVPEGIYFLILKFKGEQRIIKVIK